MICALQSSLEQMIHNSTLRYVWLKWPIIARFARALIHVVWWITQVISILHDFKARLPNSAVTPIGALSSPFLHREVSVRA